MWHVSKIKIKKSQLRIALLSPPILSGPPNCFSINFTLVSGRDTPSGPHWLRLARGGCHFFFFLAMPTAFTCMLSIRLLAPSLPLSVSHLNSRSALMYQQQQQQQQTAQQIFCSLASSQLTLTSTPSFDPPATPTAPPPTHPPLSCQQRVRAFGFDFDFIKSMTHLRSGNPLARQAVRCQTPDSTPATPITQPLSPKPKAQSPPHSPTLQLAFNEL